MEESLKTLIQQAIDVSQNAYNPYSQYAVGAALETPSGKIYTGCNVENASYPATICAERTALVKAVSDGEREFTRIVVVTPDHGTPCGVCRQMLSEFAPTMTVYLVTPDGTLQQETTLDALFPDSFGSGLLRH